jgi:hypothetical protein
MREMATRISRGKVEVRVVVSKAPASPSSLQLTKSSSASCSSRISA